MTRGLSFAVCVGCLVVEGCRGGGWEDFENRLMNQFERSDIVALGEFHGSEDDAEIRIRLIRHPMFPKRVRNIVFECGNSRHQRTLDRYIDGESVPVEQVRKILRDVTTPGASDSPAYEQFLEGVRLVNSRLPRVLRVRVLAADPPIQWSTVRDREDWVKFASDRDHFAAELIRRELLGKGQKALVVVGAGHLWQKNQLVKTANLASLLKRDYP